MRVEKKDEIFVTFDYVYDGDNITDLDIQSLDDTVQSYVSSLTSTNYDVKLQYQYHDFTDKPSSAPLVVGPREVVVVTKPCSAAYSSADVELVTKYVVCAFKVDDDAYKYDL